MINMGRLTLFSSRIQRSHWKKSQEEGKQRSLYQVRIWFIYGFWSELIESRTIPDRTEVVVVSENSAVVIALWISIAITGGILFLCVSIYSILKLDLLPKRNTRRRSSFSSPLSRDSGTENPTELTTCTNPSYLFPVSQKASLEFSRIPFLASHQPCWFFPGWL